MLEMRRCFLLIILFFSTLCMLSQETLFSLPDSLQVLLQENNKADEKRLEALKTVINTLQAHEQYQLSKPYTNELEELSNTLNDNYFQTLSIYYKGCIELWDSHFDKAFELLQMSREKASALVENEKSNILKVKIQIALGAYYFKMKQLPQAYQCYQEGIEINKDLGKASFQYTLESNLLAIYNQLGHKDDILAIGKDMLDNPAYANYNKYMVYFMMARCYLDERLCNTAEQCFDSALVYSQSHVNSAWVYLYRGIIDNNLEKYDEAIGNFNEGLLALNDANNCEIESNLLVNKGLSYARQNEYDSALFFIDKGIAEAKEFPYIQSNGYNYKCEILYQIGKYQEYAESSMLLKAIDDTLNATKDLSRLQQLELEHQFNVAKEKMEQAQLVKDMQQQRHRLILYFVIILLVFTALTVVLLLKVRLKDKQLKEETLARELDQRNRELTAKSLVENQGKVSKDFDYYFTQTHPDFYKNLSRDFPDLTPYETHLCAYIRLNLSTKEIAAICGIEPSSVKMARYRLRKSLGITDSDTDLVVFLSKY